MTYARPAFEQLRARINADLAAMPEVLRDPLAAAWARACHSQHGYLAWIGAQCSPLTCDIERLADWAALYGVPRLMARAASGLVQARGNAGAQVLAASVLRGPNGLDYTVQAAATLGAGGTAEIGVLCHTAGAAGNLAAGAMLTLIDPSAGVNSTLAVGPAGIGGGAADEALEAWRARVAIQWQAITTRGARSGRVDDWRYWAMSAHPSVTGALVQPQALGWCTVLVRPVCNALPGRLPTAAVLDAVGAYFAAVAPATADWRLAVPLQTPVHARLHLPAAQDTAAARAAAETAFTALVLSKDSQNASLTPAETDAALAAVNSQCVRLEPAATIHAVTGGVLIPAGVDWA